MELNNRTRPNAWREWAVSPKRGSFTSIPSHHIIVGVWTQVNGTHWLLSERIMAGLASTVLGSLVLVLDSLVCDDYYVILFFFFFFSYLMMMMIISWHYKWVTSCWECLGGDELSVITLSDRGWVFQKGRARPLKQPIIHASIKIHCKIWRAGSQSLRVNGRPRSSRVSGHGHSDWWWSSVHGQLKQSTHKTHGCLNLVGLTLCNFPWTFDRLTAAVGRETFLFTFTLTLPLPQPQGEAKRLRGPGMNACMTSL